MLFLNMWKINFVTSQNFNLLEICLTSDVSRASKWKPQVCTCAHTCTHFACVCVYKKVHASISVNTYLFGCLIFVFSKKQQQKGIILIFVFGCIVVLETSLALLSADSLEQLESWRTTVFVEENSVESMQWNFLHNCEFDQMGQIFLRGDEVF